jgi:hypothetical protein
MSFEIIPPFTDDEVCKIQKKLFLILGVIVAICMMVNIWTDAQLDQSARGHMAHKEARNGPSQRH